MTSNDRGPFKAPEILPNETVGDYANRVAVAASEWFGEPITFEPSQSIIDRAALMGCPLTFDIRGKHHILIGFSERKRVK